jgi:hypothetical protein
MKAVHRPAVLKQNITPISSDSSINPFGKLQRGAFFFMGASYGEVQYIPVSRAQSPGHSLPGTARPSGPELVQETISLVDLDT